MTFSWDETDRQKGEASEQRTPDARAKPRTALWSRRGLLRAALSCSGWLLVIPLLRLTQAPALIGPYLAVLIWVAGFFFAATVSIIAILSACMRRSWGVAVAGAVLAAAGVVGITRLNAQLDLIDHQYREHRAPLAELAEDFRAGRLPEGALTLPPELRSMSPSGWAYAAPGEVFVQMWQDWRHESGTGLAYFADPPGRHITISTASGDTGRPQREVGGGWWWVA